MGDSLKKQNLWKYLSVGLLGIIAIGLITPIDAKEAKDSTLLNEILDLLLDTTFGLEEIKDEVKIIEGATMSPLKMVTVHGDEIVVCTSDKPFLIHGYFNIADGDQIAVEHKIGGSASGLSYISDRDQNISFTLGTIGGEELIIAIFGSGSGGFVTIESQAGAASADCVVS